VVVAARTKDLQLLSVLTFTGAMIWLLGDTLRL
jgi:hypothetical protein